MFHTNYRRFNDYHVQAITLNDIFFQQFLFKCFNSQQIQQLIHYKIPKHNSEDQEMGRKSQEKGEGLKSMERRMSTDCNYSVLSTLMMQFLKKENLYELSKAEVQKMGITAEKNYSIIVFRIALYYRYVNFKNLYGNQSTNLDMATASKKAKQLWVWLQNSLGGCVNEKYQEKCIDFKQSVKGKCLKAIKVFRSVFEDGDFNNVTDIKGKMLKIYDKKRGKKHSKTHEKFAQKLAELAMKMLQNVGDSLINFDDLSSLTSSIRTIKSIKQKNAEDANTLTMEDSSFKDSSVFRNQNQSFNQSSPITNVNDKESDSIGNADVSQSIFNEMYQNSSLEQLIPMTGFNFNLMIGQLGHFEFEGQEELCFNEESGESYL